MSRNPFLPPQAPTEVVQPPARLPGFPFDLVLRVLIGAALCVIGALSIYGLAGQWARLTDRAFIDPWSNPWLYVPPFVAMTATGVALLMRTRYVFIPFAVYCLYSDGQALRMFGWNLPLMFVLGFGVQLALLSFLFGLVKRNRLR